MKGYVLPTSLLAAFLAAAEATKSKEHSSADKQVYRSDSKNAWIFVEKDGSTTSITVYEQTDFPS